MHYSRPDLAPTGRTLRGWSSSSGGRSVGLGCHVWKAVDSPILQERCPMSIVPTGTNTNKGRLGRSLAILAALVVVLGLVAALFVHPNSPDRPQGPEATSPGSIAPQGGRQSPSPETASAGRDTGGAEIDRLTRELEARPDDVTLLVRLGQAWMRKADQAHPRRGRPGAGPLKAPSQPSSGRNPEEALSKAGEFLERALRVDPTSRAALQQMGELRLNSMTAEARQRLREILTLNEEPIEAGADPVAVRAERAEQMPGPG